MEMREGTKEMLQLMKSLEFYPSAPPRKSGEVTYAYILVLQNMSQGAPPGMAASQPSYIGEFQVEGKTPSQKGRR